MATSITQQDLIAPLDPDWAEKGRENTRRANQNDANLRTAADDAATAAAAAVKQIKIGTTTYTPTAGLVELPAGVTATPLTTTQRDAITNPAIGLLILNITTGRVEVYGATGWTPVGGSQLDVFIASGTWTKPQGCKFVLIIAIGAGASGNAYVGNASNSVTLGGAGGARATNTIIAGALPASVPVSVGAPGASATGSTAGTNYPGSPGGPSSFGSFVIAGGGGLSGDVRARGMAGSHIPKWTANSAIGAVFSTTGGSQSQSGQESTLLGHSASAPATNINMSAPSYYSGEAHLSGGPGAGASGQARTSSQFYTGVGGSPLSADAKSYDGSTTPVSANTSTANGSVEILGGGTGASRSGTGLGGDGGNSAAGNTGTVTGSPGQAPGGGGGAAASYNAATVTSGAGARGEVLVLSLF